MSRTVGVIAFLGAAVLGASAQSSRDGTLPATRDSTYSGRVLAAETGDPLPHARVVLFADAAPVSAVYSDRDGRFDFAARPTGRYRVSATKAGYIARSVRVSDRASAHAVEVRLQRSAAIAGRVVDGSGEPLAGVRVNVAFITGVPPPGLPEGPAVLTSASARIVQSDDLGEYRVGGLPEGVVVVWVDALQVADSGALNRAATYYPGVTTLTDAQRIGLHAGDERVGIDFQGLPSGDSLYLAQQLTQVQGGRAVTVRTPAPVSQPPGIGADQNGTSTIHGRVTRADGLALSRATVTARAGRGLARTRSVSTDEDGRFELSELPAGAYQVRADKAGYVSFAYGEKPLGAQADPALSAGELVRVSEGQTVSRIDIVLPRHSAMTGRVTDEFGDPVEGAVVNLAQIAFQSGRRRLVGVNGAASALTDDLGRYRIYGLQPGRYIVRAVSGEVVAFQPTADFVNQAPTYFPGTDNPLDAQAVAVESSQDLPSIDLTLVRVQTARIAGTRLRSNGEPLGGSLVLVPSQRSGAILTPPTGARTYPDGRFDFPNVPPGEYVIQADAGKVDGSSEGDFATQFVTIGGEDVTGVVLQASAGSTIKGRVIAEGESAPPPGSLTIVPARADGDRTPLNAGSIARADVQRDGTFAMTGIRGPRRLSLERAPAGWMLKRVLANGIDVTDRPLPFGSAEQSLNDVEVIVTDRVTEISGVALDGAGRPAANYAVVAFPTDRTLWYSESRFLARSAPGRGGMFNVRGLPPGEYFVAAVDGLRASPGDEAWRDPEVLESLALHAARVSLTESQSVSINPRLFTLAR